MVWVRGHQQDWDFFASEANDPAWSYESVLKLYRRLEDWHGVPDPILIDANTLSDPDDLKTAIVIVELCREVGNSAPLRPFVKREVMPISGLQMDRFCRESRLVTQWLPA